jgi:hypothetical protein
MLSILAVLGLCLISLNVDAVHPSIAEAANSREAIGLTKDNPGIRKAIEVQFRHSERLMGISGVVGHGIGISSDGKPVIKIFVTRAGIPGIPPALEGVPTKVEVTGMVVAYADPTKRFRPVLIGVSTGHPDITAGTIGCRVTGDLVGDDGIPEVYVLSNNHIYANENEAIIGDNVLQPGPYDGGQDPVDAIGTLFDFQDINFKGGDNFIDAAIAEPYTSVPLLCSTPDDGYGTPSSTTVDAKVGQGVQKYGRTTGWTHGEVDTINTLVDVCYQTRGRFLCVKSARFVDQVAITPGTFSAGGDSGSLIVTDDENNYPVALLFSGSSTHTFASPIDLVLGRFTVSVDDCSTCIPSQEACDDGVDNDCDDLIDCDDPDCADAPNCSTCIPSQEACDDGVDNDCDGATDCADSDCMDVPDCTFSCLDLGVKCRSDSDCCSGDCRGKCR